MPVITLTVFQMMHKTANNPVISSSSSAVGAQIPGPIDYSTSWHVEIHGLEEADIPYLEEKIPTFQRRGGTILSTELLREDPDILGHLPQFHPPMGRVTKILNRLDGIGYKIISSTTLTNSDQRHCIVWTLLK